MAISNADQPTLYTPYNKIRFRVYKTLAIANADSRPLLAWEIGVIKGDSTRFKLGIGFYSGTGYPDAAPPRGTKFANLPWYNSLGSGILQPIAVAAQGSLNATGTLTAAILVKKYITTTSAAAVTATLDTATNINTLIGAVQGTEVDFEIDNSAGANTFTVAVGTGITIATPALTGGNNMAVIAGSFGKFKIIFKTPTTALIFRTL